MRILLLLPLLFFSCRQRELPKTVLPANREVEKPVATLPAPIPQEDNSDLKAFVPAGYEILDTASGNLNGDAYTDFLLVLKKPTEEKTSDVVAHPEKRPLLILTGTAGGTLELAARNNSAIYCVDCGGMMGDPYMGLVIKNGYFSVEHYGGSSWRWSRTITFKWSATDNTWLLHKDGGDSFHTSDIENVKTKVETQKDFGKVPFEKFDIYKKD